MKKTTFKRYSASLAMALAISPSAFAAANLTPYNVNITDTSVSGLSAGGFMAVQLQVVYSDIMKGAGIIAGGPYDCAGQNSYTTCMSGSPDVTPMINITNTRSGSSIANKANLANHKVFLFSGTKDTTVYPSVMNKLRDYYTTSPLVPTANVQYKNNIAAQHTFPTDFDSTGNVACGTGGTPWISNCSYDGAGAILQWIYGSLNARNNGTLGGQFVQFNQSEFISNANANGMDTAGWLYVPAACSSGAQCKLHVSFHGCGQGYAKIGDKYLKNTGYAKWADTNNIIILSPQAVVDYTTHSTNKSGTLSNPNGCFDWVGWYGASFDTNVGVQVAAVKKMIDRITSGYVALAAPTGVTVTGTGNNTVSLSWNSVNGAAGYNVYNGGAKANSSLITSTAYTVAGLQTGTSYAFTVKAVNAAGAEGSASSSVSATTSGPVPPLSPPAGLAAGTTTATTVPLTWTAVSGATGYNVYQNGSKITSSPVTVANYTASGLTALTTYSYTVTAVGASGESAQSGSVSATTKSSWTCSVTTASNYAHVQAGRAHDSMGIAYANGSNANMGLDNLFYNTTLAQTSAGYYVIGSCP